MRGSFFCRPASPPPCYDRSERPKRVAVSEPFSIPYCVLYWCAGGWALPLATVGVRCGLVMGRRCVYGAIFERVSKRVAVSEPVSVAECGL
jgi:hypothetical protein